ncbi:MAG: hypothetical protein GX552_14700 [Chloroflexi bacterium]|jgi:hypothetical protein|nr:hypothetical protein [Chloroflexota bacterium]
MKRRWLGYIGIGILFGVVDFFYLHLLARLPWEEIFAHNPLGQTVRWVVQCIVLNLGFWLVPVIPAALREARVSRSSVRSAIASLVIWCTGIVAYYLTNAAQLGLLGVPGREELHISNRNSPLYWENWVSVLRGDVLGGIVEYITVAVVGGAIVGLGVSAIYLHCNKTPQVAKVSS